MDVDKQALLDFMVEKLGGEDAVMLEFRENRICEAAAAGKTLGQLIDEANNEGWIEHFKRLKVSGLVKIIERSKNGSKPRQAAATAASARKPERHPRMSPEEKMALHASIVDHLTKKPWTGVGEISKVVGLDTRRLGLHLRQMKKDGVLESKGENRLTTYSVK